MSGVMANYWPVWLVWIVGFLVLEFNALRLRKKYPDVNYNGGTLSELVWWIINGKAWWHHVAYAVFLAFFVDLGFHFFTQTALF